MEDKEIIAGNKLIAEFMGGEWKFQDDSIYHRYGWFFQLDNLPTPYSSCWHDENHLAYASEWNWLMPVVEKIGSLKAYTPDGKELSLISCISTSIDWDAYFNKGRMSIIGTITFCHTKSIPQSFDKIDIPHIVNRGEYRQPLIEVVWKTVIDFIEWYNTQGK